MLASSVTHPQPCAQTFRTNPLDNLFNGDAEAVKSKPAHANALFRALLAKCGNPDLSISKTWLNDVVGIAAVDFYKRPPRRARSSQRWMAGLPGLSASAAW